MVLLLAIPRSGFVVSGEGYTVSGCGSRVSG